MNQVVKTVCMIFLAIYFGQNIFVLNIEAKAFSTVSGAENIIADTLHCSLRETHCIKKYNRSHTHSCTDIHIASLFAKSFNISLAHQPCQKIKQLKATQ